MVLMRSDIYIRMESFSASAQTGRRRGEDKMKRFVPKYLDPASRLGEILFGLIMVLTVTLSAGLTADDGRAGLRQLLAAASAAISRGE